MEPMRIGFAAIYSWRPHVEHLYFLAQLAQKAGHESHFLACDGDLPSCYTRELRGRARWRECLQCRAGSIRSYTGRRVDSIGARARKAPLVNLGQAAYDWAYSSASTLGRFESDADYDGAEFRDTQARLAPAVARSYAAASEWIRANELDAVCLFNGRMDVTRAIAEASRAADIRFVSLERTWFGDGLQLLPDESCLGLRSVHSMVAQWRDRPLTSKQALMAVSHVAQRFTRTNVREWRAYNQQARAITWPGGNAPRKILLLPSSGNEVRGQMDWKSQWPEPTAAYDALLAHLDAAPGEVVLRCHPNWAEKIGKCGGERAERYYTDWARHRGIPCIPSADSAGTTNLIEQCDAIVVAGGSAALEAGILGKQVIGSAPSPYQEAGFRDPAYTAAQVSSLRLHAELERDRRESLSRDISRRTLRFLYTVAHRIPQYTSFVRAETTTKYWYDLSADPQRFINLLTTGNLRADDDTFTETTDGEDEVLDLVRKREWGALRYVQGNGGNRGRVNRRPLFRYIDWISDRKPVGDR
jgi:hypothetical protein